VENKLHAHVQATTTPRAIVACAYIVVCGLITSVGFVCGYATSDDVDGEGGHLVAMLIKCVREGDSGMQFQASRRIYRLAVQVRTRVFICRRVNEIMRLAEESDLYGEPVVGKDLSSACEACVFGAF
jgi:hypothetical protein